MFTDRRVNTRTTKRERQPWPARRPFKILALDGGGIKGLFTAHLLRHCEQNLAKGKPLADYFDMIAGTSTGGIIALGLGLGRTTEEIVSFYETDGRRIFPPYPATALGKAWRLVSSFFRPILNHEELEVALKRRFSDDTLGQAGPRIVVPAFMMPKTEIAVFKTDHHPDFRNDHATPAWKVARATSAAPTYLKGHEHAESGQIFIDGGVWANNPVMVAIVDALTCYDITLDQIEVLSIGTGNPPFELSRNRVFAGLLAWREVIMAAMFLTTDNATAQAMLLLGPDNLLRIEPSDEAATIKLDDFDRAQAELPPLASAHFASYGPALAKFFEQPATPREKFYA
ncbi:CBASS cGAMP-activated phospholipase [Erythrobacter sp. BLCC-B19]|uniref:CBASS cGAMP-activated phospholipase n=1 Tax=Erythrobacter sp. BLCC-B19 TaxID=3025315 RepID=UPI00236131B5|nr:CBASS cGAMP-activated phospholipase [Erythrobacter sp. BLCC-B19]WDA39612.1 CBASS cGAMP-activated phospholipase [Erythrobacter sp. BLCC-B19]